MRFDVILDFRLKSMEVGTKGFGDFLDELFSVAIFVTRNFVRIVNTQGKIFRHKAFLNSLNN